MKRAGRWLALAAGLALFALYLRGADLRAVAGQLLGLGTAALLLPIPYFLVYLADTLGWRWSFAIPPRVSFAVLVRIRWCGESVNNLVPTAYVGGEALKVLLLARHGVDTAAGTAAALISKTAQTVAQVLFLALGSAAFLLHAGHHPGLKAAMATVLGGGLLVVALLLLAQRRGVFGGLLKFLDRCGIHPAWLVSRRARLLEMDGVIAEFYSHHRPRFLIASTCFLAGWLLDTTEIWLASHLLGLPISWSRALAIESFVGVVKVVGMWVPGALGVQESGIVYLVRLAGGPDLLGATYALLRRARELVFAGIGWALFLTSGPAASRHCSEHSAGH